MQQDSSKEAKVGSQRCPHCRGSGRVYCGVCVGKGHIIVGDVDKLCHSCHGAGSAGCPNCSGSGHMRVGNAEFFVSVQGNDAVEVERVTLALMTKLQMRAPRPSPWASGSFYLCVFIVVCVALLSIARILPFIVVPIVIIGTILSLAVIGAFQLRHDERLSQKSFLELMALSFRYLPWLKRRDHKGKEQET